MALRAVRVKRVAPVSRSRADICWETADAVYPRLVAAPLKDPWRITSSSVRRWIGLTN